MVDYILKKSMRAKNIRITITRDALVVVTLPYRFPELLAKKFVLDKVLWIEKNLEITKKRQLEHKDHRTPSGSKEEFHARKKEALDLVHERLKYFNKEYGYTWNNISIKNVSSRWGSCSKKGNLNFSYKVVLLSPPLRDYIVVHELCHLGQFNHSDRFWGLVEKTIPDYKILRKELRGVI